MSGVICKLFIRSRTENPNGGPTHYELGVVCRGDENKHWAAATPSGTMKQAVHPTLDAVWDGKKNGLLVNPEVLVTIRDGSEDDEWVMEKCEFTYGGCAVRFSQKATPWGSIELTVNNGAATQHLREAFAAGLLKGESPRVKVDIEAAT